MPGLGDQPVDHHLDGVLLLLVEADRRPRARRTTPSTRARVKPALRACSSTSRCSPLRSFTSGARSRNFVPAGRSAISCTICCDDCWETGRPQLVAGEPAHARPEHAQVVVDLGDGAHRGARVAAGRLLLDGDGGGQAADGVVERLVHLPEELPGVGGQALDVAALALGVERVEGQATTSRAETPVKTTSFFLGISTVTFLRLCWRAPVMMMRSSSIGLRGPGRRTARRTFYSTRRLRRAPSPQAATSSGESEPRHRGRAAGPLESPKAGQGRSKEEVSWHRDPGASFSSSFRSRWGRHASRPPATRCPAEPSSP